MFKQKKEGLHYFITEPVDQLKKKTTFVDIHVRKQYDKEQGKKSNANKPANRPVSKAVFETQILPKLAIDKTWMTNVDHYDNKVKPTIGVLTSPEMVAFLIDNGVDPKRIFFVSDDQKWKSDMVVDMGIDMNRILMLKSVSSYERQNTMAMLKNQLTEKQFDLVLMNPPYELTSEFMEIGKTIVKADGQIGVICDAKQASNLNWNQIADYEYTANNFDGVNLNTIVAVINQSGVNETLLADLHGRKMTVESDKINVAPTTDLELWRPANKILGERLSGIDLGHTGTLKGREVIESKSGIPTVGYEMGGKFKTAPGRTNEPLPIIKVAKSLHDKIGNIDDHMVVFGADHEPGKIGAIKYKAPGVGVASRCHGIVVNSAAEAKRVQEYLNSDAVKKLVSVIKITAKNSKDVFSKIPHWTNSKTWMNHFA